MKRYVVKIAAAAFFLIVIVCSFGISAGAMKIDGILTDSEWKNAPVFVLENQRNFDNKINSAVVKTVTDKKNGCIYLSVMIEFKKTGNLKDGAVKISVNGTSPALIELGSGVAESGGYPMEAASDIDELSGCTVTEIAVHFKEGPSSAEQVKIIIVDLNGEESGVYTVDAKEKEPETTTTRTTTTKTTTTKTTKSTTTKTTTTKTTKTTTTTTRTTKEKTSAEKSNATKEKISEEKSLKSEITEKSTDEKSAEDEDTSKEKKAEEDFNFKKVVKTKAEKTAEAVKTTRLPKKSKALSKLKKSSAGSADEEKSVSKIKTAATEDEKQPGNDENQDVIYPDEGKNRKYIFVVIGAASAAALAAAAVAATVKSNKKDDE